MTKKTPTEIAIPNVRNEVAFGQPDAELAAWLGLNLSASPNVRTEQAMAAYNAATRSMVESGLLLASVKAEIPSDEFKAMLEERGLPFQRAYELMNGAALAARLPEAQREQVLLLPKTKVLALASASPAVVQMMLEDGGASLDLISVRAMRERIRDLEAATTDLTVQRDKAESEAESLRKRTERGAREDGMPYVIADLRAEATVLSKQASMAVESFGLLYEVIYPLSNPLTAVDVNGHHWVDGSVRLVLAALAAQRMLLDGQISRWLSLLPEGEDNPLATDAFAYLSQEETRALAQEWPKLIAVHEHEKALREWEREQARPRSKGRPSAKPVAPKA